MNSRSPFKLMTANNLLEHENENLFRILQALCFRKTKVAKKYWQDWSLKIQIQLCSYWSMTSSNPILSAEPASVDWLPLTKLPVYETIYFLSFISTYKSPWPEKKIETVFTAHFLHSIGTMNWTMVFSGFISTFDKETCRGMFVLVVAELSRAV